MYGILVFCIDYKIMQIKVKYVSQFMVLEPDHLIEFLHTFIINLVNKRNETRFNIYWYICKDIVSTWLLFHVVRAGYHKSSDLCTHRRNTLEWGLFLYQYKNIIVNENYIIHLFFKNARLHETINKTSALIVSIFLCTNG